MKSISLLLLCSFLFGCQKLELGTESTQTLSSTPLAGKINGSAWKVAYGEATPNSLDSRKLDLVLWDTQAHVPCTNFPIPATERQVYLTLSPVEAEANLSSQDTYQVFSAAGFLYKSNSSLTKKPATSGKVDIQTVSPATLTAAVQISDGISNEVNGTFTVQICH